MRSTFLLFALALAGCAAPPALRPPEYKPETLAAPAATEPRPAPPNAWSDCWSAFRGTGDEKGNLAKLTRACENGQDRLTPTHVASQSADDPSQKLTFVVAGARRCLRVYAVGGSGVGELELTLRGVDGEPIARDDAPGPVAVAPAARPLCVEAEGVYTIDVAVPRGGGAYALEVWSGS